MGQEIFHEKDMTASFHIIVETGRQSRNNERKNETGNIDASNGGPEASG
jgi:hypothetical protein